MTEWPVKSNCVDRWALASQQWHKHYRDHWLFLRNRKDRLSYVKCYYIVSFNFLSFVFKSFSSWRTTKFSQINCLTNTFLYIVRSKWPFFDFRISPYSFFNALASFQLTLTGINNP